MFVKIFILILFLTVNLFSQKVILRAKTDSSKIKLATPFKIILEAEINGNYYVQFPKLENSSKDFEIISESKLENSTRDGKIITSKKLTLINFTLDSLKIPPFKISYTNPNDSIKYFAESDTLILSVLPIALDTLAKIREIKNPLEVPIKWSDIAEISLIIIAVLSVAYLIYFLRNRKKQTKVEEKPEIILPPEVIALQKLAEIENGNLILEGKYKLFYSKISDCLRLYFEMRYKFLAVEQTTTEILNELKNYPIEINLHLTIKEILEESDLVKFAKFIPEKSICDRVIPIAKKIILETTPIYKTELQNV
ncbi:MAG: hypothetical protein O3A55_03545 [Bacteroidetes bacterium]|nr:hypothetical protein [Bacteroidota bacterium]